MDIRLKLIALVCVLSLKCVFAQKMDEHQGNNNNLKESDSHVDEISHNEDQSNHHLDNSDNHRNETDHHGDNGDHRGDENNHHRDTELKGDDDANFGDSSDGNLDSNSYRLKMNPGWASIQYGHCKCSKSVMWEFRRMDTSRDRYLNFEELASIESIQREPCLKPMIKSCDKNNDGELSRREWCCCMVNTVPPCAEKKQLLDNADWEPKCTAEGYYEREQCDKNGYCWCVDLNGNLTKDTKKMGSADCGKYDPSGQLI